MNILILGLNYAPEPIGIGRYTAGMAQALAKAGHRVAIVAGKPYYPSWKVEPEFAEHGYQRKTEDGVEITRCPIYVPAKPTGLKRLVHHASFAIAALPVMLKRALTMRPDVVMAIAPSLVSVPAAKVAARLSGAQLWLHVQDFEVESAFATGLIDRTNWVARLALKFENWIMSADRVSSISPQMCAKLTEKGVSPDRIVEFRNWASLDSVRPLTAPSRFREEWRIEHKHVALYSGNIANKQGIGIIVEAAARLRHRRDLLFVICGNGANREKLIESANGLDNIRFFDLQPAERLSDLLGLASIHLLPQIAGAADLVLPSKLTNVLASGRPVVATARAGTGLWREVEGCGVLTEPGDAGAFAAAIDGLVDDEAARTTYGAMARRRAEERWGKQPILDHFQAQLAACVAHRPARRRDMPSAASLRA